MSEWLSITGHIKTIPMDNAKVGEIEYSLNQYLEHLGLEEHDPKNPDLTHYHLHKAKNQSAKHNTRFLGEDNVQDVIVGITFHIMSEFYEADTTEEVHYLTERLLKNLSRNLGIVNFAININNQADRENVQSVILNKECEEGTIKYINLDR